MEEQDERNKLVSKNFLNDGSTENTAGTSLMRSVEFSYLEIKKDPSELTDSTLIMESNEFSCLEIKEDPSEVADSSQNVKKESDNVFIFDKNTEIKREYNDFQNVKKEECTANYDTENYITKYEDFQLTNEEVYIKQDVTSTEG